MWTGQPCYPTCPYWDRTDVRLGSHCVPWVAGRCRGVARLAQWSASGRQHHVQRGLEPGTGHRVRLRLRDRRRQWIVSHKVVWLLAHRVGLVPAQDHHVHDRGARGGTRSPDNAVDEPPDDRPDEVCTGREQAQSCCSPDPKSFLTRSGSSVRIRHAGPLTSPLRQPSAGARSRCYRYRVQLPSGAHRRQFNRLPAVAGTHPAEATHG